MPQPGSIAFRTNLPGEVPPGGTIVVLVNGRPATHDALQGPGLLRPDAWRKEGQRIEAIIFPRTSLQLRFEVANLRSAEDVRLDVSITLALRIADPLRFFVDVVRDAASLSEDELAARLAETVRMGLAPLFGRTPLAELDANPRLRGWLGTAVEHVLRDESDLAGRSGLALVGVDAYDLRCPMRARAQETAEAWYLRAALAQADAAGRKLLDAATLAELQRALPVREELLGHKERLAELAEQELAADARLAAASAGAAWPAEAWVAALRHPPSQLRPELWRHDLRADIAAAPLYAEGRVYLAIRDGRVHAFAAKDGTAAWPEAAQIGATPGDALVLANDTLWAPGHDGVLYGLEPATGLVRHRIPIGGRLSSAPVLLGDLLYLAVDVDAATQRAGTGEVVEVDAARGQVRRRWQVSRHGLRAAPAILGGTLYVGDRSGRFFSVDLRPGRVEPVELPAGSGRILGASLADEARGQVVVGDSYGRLTALDRAGRVRWTHRLGGSGNSVLAAVVGRPLVVYDLLIVGAADGLVYVLNAGRGTPAAAPFATRGPIATSPVVWQELAFVGSNDGYLYALDLPEAGPPKETRHLACFWQYHSGAAVCVAPAVGDDGHLYVADSAGHLNALRPYLARYAEGARREEAAHPPRWDEAAELWLLAGEVQAALEAADRAGRPNLVAELAAGLGWHDRAARTCEQAAQRQPDALRAATWWQKAADAWTLAGDAAAAERCCLASARARRAPLLSLSTANLPRLTAGQPEAVQVAIRNLTDVLACDIVLAYAGHVQRAEERPLGALGPQMTRIEEIVIVPTQSGYTILRLEARYGDAQCRPQPPVRLEIRLRAQQPPEVHQHFYGPYIGKDGVIIMRGERRQRIVQAGEDRIELGEAPESQ